MEEKSGKTLQRILKLVNILSYVLFSKWWEARDDKKLREMMDRKCD